MRYTIKIQTPDGRPLRVEQTLSFGVAEQISSEATQAGLVAVLEIQPL